MDLDLTDDERAFRLDVRDFLARQLPADLRDKVRGARRLAPDDHRRWQRLLHRHGWGAPTWPVEFGGTGWTPVQRHLFDEECANAGAPVQLAFGLRMVGPVIMKFGTPAQQRRWLPSILDGSVWWCQGYSEPGAGSDLASLKTRAVRDGDHYVVNGQKTWTTYAQHADWMFCLVRTDPEARKQEGISFLVFDMKTPGITVRRIELLGGEHEVNEVFFDDVRVPADQLIGGENRGWTCAKYLLGHERLGGAGVAVSKALLRSLQDTARRVGGDDGRPLIEDRRFRDRIAQVALELMALEVTYLKAISARGRDGPGTEASVLKLKGAWIRQQLTELRMLALGPHAAPSQLHWLDGATDDGLEPLFDGYASGDAAATAHYLNFRKASIYGGSDEVQRGIVAKQVLGL